MAGYKWKGTHTGPDLFDATEPKPRANGPQPCGTRAAYKRHAEAGEQPCEPCRTAEADYKAGRRAKQPQRPKPAPKPAPKKKEPAPCGTTAAYHRHVRYREIPCAACKKVHADHMAQRRGGRTGQTEAKCGTRSGYHKHLRAGEPTCLDCRRANNQFMLERKRTIEDQQAA